MWICFKLAMYFILLTVVVAIAMAVSGMVSGIMSMMMNNPEWKTKMKDKWPDVKEKMMCHKDEFEEKPM